MAEGKKDAGQLYIDWAGGEGGRVGRVGQGGARRT